MDYSTELATLDIKINKVIKSIHKDISNDNEVNFKYYTEQEDKLEIERLKLEKQN